MTELEDDAVALIAQDIAAKRPDLVRLMVLSDTTARIGYYDL